MPHSQGVLTDDEKIVAQQQVVVGVDAAAEAVLNWQQRLIHFAASNGLESLFEGLFANGLHVLP